MKFLLCEQSLAYSSDAQTNDAHRHIMVKGRATIQSFFKRTEFPNLIRVQYINVFWLSC